MDKYVSYNEEEAALEMLVSESKERVALFFILEAAKAYKHLSCRLIFHLVWYRVNGNQLQSTHNFNLVYLNFTGPYRVEQGDFVKV